MRIPLPLSSPLAQRYGRAIENACNAIADHGYLHRPVTMILALLWERLRRTMQRLDRLALRWQAGERLIPRPR
eukprot:gene46839-63460_t